MGTILLARHGETEWNRRKRLQGWAPVPLNDRGREQARALATYLDGSYALDRVYASDLRRARQTAEIVTAEAFPELDPVLEPAWRERDFGVYQGLEYGPDGNQESGDRSPIDSTFPPTPESGESLTAVRERVLDHWRDLCELCAGPDEDGDTALVVAHGGTIKLLLGHLYGLDVSESMTELDQDNCAVTEVRLADGSTSIVRENHAAFY